MTISQRWFEWVTSQKYFFLFHSIFPDLREKGECENADWFKHTEAIKKTQLWRHVPKVGKELISSKLTYDDLMSYYFMYNIYSHDDYSLHKLPSLSFLY